MITETSVSLAPRSDETALETTLDYSVIIDRFLLAHDIKPKSKETYRRALRQFFTYLSDNGITKPTRESLIAYKVYLIDKNLSAYTVSAYIIATRKLFQWTESERIYPNIASQIKGQKKPKGFKKDALSVKQAQHLLTIMETDTLSGARDYALVNLLVRTGLRTIEATRADIEDIRQQGEQAVLFIQGKGRDSKDDIVILTDETLEPIRAYISMRGQGVRDSSPLFISHSDRNYGERLTTRSVSRIVKEKLQASGLDDKRLTAHSLRHTAVTFSLIGGASIQEAQTLARHSDINTTLIYAHNLDRISKAPEHKIDALLGNTRNVNNVYNVNTKMETA
jgi:integrase/recombinase XerC/integrase/recombinase XerD